MHVKAQHDSPVLVLLTACQPSCSKACYLMCRCYLSLSLTLLVVTWADTVEFPTFQPTTTASSGCCQFPSIWHTSVDENMALSFKELWHAWRQMNCIVKFLPCSQLSWQAIHKALHMLNVVCLMWSSSQPTTDVDPMTTSVETWMKPHKVLLLLTAQMCILPAA